MSVLRVGLGAAVLLAVSSTAAHAQRFGIYGGANFEALVNLQGEDFQTGFRMSEGFHAGGFVELRKGTFSLRPGLLYQNAGTLFQGQGVLATDNFRLNQVALPVDIKWKPPIRYLYIFAGPEAQYNLSNGVPDEFQDVINKFTVRGGAGLGFEVGHWHVEGRYLLTLTSLTKSDYGLNGTVFTDVNQYSQAIRASLGFSF
jgi:hypothetical protein